MKRMWRAHVIGGALITIVLSALSCYDHLHPPATPGGNPADVPPLTDSKKKDGGR